MTIIKSHKEKCNFFKLKTELTFLNGTKLVNLSGWEFVVWKMRGGYYFLGFNLDSYLTLIVFMRSFHIFKWHFWGYQFHVIKYSIVLYLLLSKCHILVNSHGKCIQHVSILLTVLFRVLLMAIKNFVCFVGHKINLKLNYNISIKEWGKKNV